MCAGLEAAIDTLCDQLPEGVRTNGVTAEVRRFPLMNFHGKMWTYGAFRDTVQGLLGRDRQPNVGPVDSKGRSHLLLGRFPKRRGIVFPDRCLVIVSMRSPVSLLLLLSNASHFACLLLV